MRGHPIALFTFAVTLAIASAQAADGRWFFSTGFDYSNGDYGEQRDTTILTVPLSSGYVADRWSVALIVPIVSVKGPGTIVPGGLDNGGALGGLLGSTPATASSLAKGVDTTGLGDASLTVSATPYVSDAGTQFLVISRVRAPTGDESHALGTGEWAASLSGGVRQPLGTRADVYGAVGYERTLRGDGNGVIAQLGAESYVADKVQLGAVLNYAQATSALQRDGAQAGVFVAYDLSSVTRLQAYGAAGLSETSPAISAGFRIVFSPE